MPQEDSAFVLSWTQLSKQRVVIIILFWKRNKQICCAWNLHIPTCLIKKPKTYIYHIPKSYSFMDSKTDLLEGLNLTGVRLIFHNHHLQIIFFSVKTYGHIIVDSGSYLCITDKSWASYERSASPFMLSSLICVHVLQLVQLRVQDGDVGLRLQ